MAIRIYLDTVAIIGAVEGDDDEVAGRLAQVLTSEAATCVSSDLALAELLVGAWRPDKNGEWLALSYERLFSADQALLAVAVDRRVLIRAARLRAGNLALKLPDAIQLATALMANCELVLSNDRKFLRFARKQGMSAYSLNRGDLDALLSQLSAPS